MKIAQLAEDGKHELKGHIKFQGLRLAIENRKGDVRQGVSRNGHHWRTVMKNPYGFIEGSQGKDGEGVDVYVGPKKKAPLAFVVHQRKPDGTGFDEDKVMLGFGSEEAAAAAYLEHYDDPKFLGPISAVPMEKLKEVVTSGKPVAKITGEEKAAMYSAFVEELGRIAEAR